MNKIEIINEKFAYLKEFGFIYEYINNKNLVLVNRFTFENTSIEIYEDYRHEFLALEINKNDLIILELVGTHYVKNIEFIGYDELIISLSEIYNNAFKKYISLSDEYFAEIANVYSIFVKNNIFRILNV